jgi:hypothetical protein
MQEGMVVRRRSLITASALAGVCFLIGIPAGASSQRASSAAAGSRLLEPPLTVPPTGEIKTTRTTLVKGNSYRLVLTGSVTTTNDRGTSDRFDALYCYETFGTPPLGDPTTGSCTTNTRRQANLTAGIGKPVGGLIEYQLNPSLLNKISYQSSHRYELRFRAKRAGKLTFKFSTFLAQKSGSYQVALYGQQARKKKRKKAAGPQACRAPARGSGASARAAASCHWTVNYQVREDTPGALPALASSTTGAGRVTFDKEPKLGRLATGVASGSLAYGFEYPAPGSDQSAPGSVDLTVEPLTASYRYSDGFVKLVLGGVVTDVSKTGNVPPIEDGDTVQILLFDGLGQGTGNFADRYEMSISIKKFGSGKLTYSRDFREGPIQRLAITLPRASSK